MRTVFLTNYLQTNKDRKKLLCCEVHQSTKNIK